MRLLDLSNYADMCQLTDAYFVAYPHRAREAAVVATVHQMTSPVLSAFMYKEMAEFGVQHGWISHEQCQRLITTIRQLQCALHNEGNHHA